MIEGNREQPNEFPYRTYMNQGNPNGSIIISIKIELKKLQSYELCLSFKHPLLLLSIVAQGLRVLKPLNVRK